MDERFVLGNSIKNKQYNMVETCILIRLYSHNKPSADEFIFKIIILQRMYYIIKQYYAMCIFLYFCVGRGAYALLLLTRSIVTRFVN